MLPLHGSDYDHAYEHGHEREARRGDVDTPIPLSIIGGTQSGRKREATVARTFVTDLKSGDEIKQAFLVHEKVLRSTRSGSLYMQLDLTDRTGRLPSRMWDAERELFESFKADEFVLVRGNVETYQNRLQLIVKAIERVPESSVDLADFMATTEFDVDEMFGRLIEIAKIVKHAGLRKLLAAFLKDDELVAKLKRAPAATSNHHAFIGGLLEHTLAVSELALQVAGRYPKIDHDLLVTGVILHDVGKIDEFDYERSLSYSDEGQLLGHLFIGARMVEERSRDIPEMTPELVLSLSHLILSHHGRYEYQSPKLPMTCEALIVHHLDNLDAKINAFHTAVERDQNPDSRWTEWNRMFERRLFKGHGDSDQ
jgi:3'-5' exoribonuclease